MKEENFIKFAKHFVHRTRSSADRPLLLLLDNHDSHLTIEALNYFKENGVTVLSCPPLCSHEQQLLDRSFYGPLKKYINSSCDNWMLIIQELIISYYLRHSRNRKYSIAFS